MKPLKKNATHDDLREIPDRFVAEMFDGDLYASPRPAIPHTRAASVLGAALMGAFDQGRNGPGGWLLLYEPELHFGNDVLVPDLAAWGRARLPALPAAAYLTLAPDWVCEVLSVPTERLDRGEKLRVYARERVAYAWLIDPSRQTLEVLALDRRGQWAKRAILEGRANVRAAPFDAVELELGALWI
ncbi:MAG TPA: Uma2 family endonuclease [Gammaproteobacteria bacterium]|nr:Uma2 family endonuclease [Gammaproteobacteria bacterium]